MTEAKKKWTVFQRSSTRVALGLAVSLSAIAIFPSTLASQPSPSVATDYNNLALSLQAQGKYAEAESLFRRAIEIDEKALGKDHPKVATDYRNLNNLLSLLRTMEPAGSQATVPLARATPAAPPRRATVPSAPETAPANAPRIGTPKEAPPPAGSQAEAAQASPKGAPPGGAYNQALPQAAPKREQEAVQKEAPSNVLPQFPWPPPAASGSYVLPDNLLQDLRTVGEAATAIISALEFNGYVERSFFQTEAGGVALVTRLERINNDGSSVVGSQRWSAVAEHPESTADLINFLRGLFYIDPGHYRVIVFILQDLPFSQSSRKISEQEAITWLTTGFNFLPSSVAERPFAPGGHCTVLVYEFASDGRTVHVITSGLTGKQHLEKAGVLSRLGNVQ